MSYRETGHREMGLMYTSRLLQQCVELLKQTGGEAQPAAANLILYLQATDNECRSASAYRAEFGAEVPPVGPPSPRRSW
jgi:hypothetical protein